MGGGRGRDRQTETEIKGKPRKTRELNRQVEEGLACNETVRGT